MSFGTEYNSGSDSTTEEFGQKQLPAAAVPTGKDYHTGVRTLLTAVSLLSTSGQQTVFYRALWFAHDLGGL